MAKIGVDVGGTFTDLILERDGSAIALTEKLPGVAVHPVEPEDFDDTGSSKLRGRG